MILLSATDDNFIMWVVGSILGLIITYFLFRWVFAIDKRVSQNEQIIGLLKKLTGDQGAQSTPDKIPTTKEEILQRKYDKGEITFEQYKKEWDEAQ